MNKVILLNLLLGCAPFQILFAIEKSEQVDVTVIVVNQDQRPIPNANVRGAFANMTESGGDVLNVKTDDEGKALLMGRSSMPIDIVVSHENYYESKASLKHYQVVDGEIVFKNKSIDIVLRKIVEPSAMYARRDFKIKIPEFEKQIGFDLFESDWVHPHGKGKQSDFTLKMSGYWNHFNDKDGTLTLSFPAKGDGLVSIRNHYYSEFVSPYNAPQSNYETSKSWRCARIKNMDRQPGSTEPKILVIKEGSPRNNYAFRIRSELDENGEIEKAFYGKFYGDFNFYGVTQDERYNYISFSYYLNAVKNDRNLEFDPRQNLFVGLDLLEIPQKP